MCAAVVDCLHTNHLNLVTENFETSVERFGELFGAQFVADMPQKEWHAGLITFGGVIIEVFSPYEYLINARYGPHFLGMEYQCQNVSEAREAVIASGVRIVRDINVAFHVHPADAFGVAFEFWDENFHLRDSSVYKEPFKPLEYWRDEHPMGCVGLKRYSVAVGDIDAATKFFQSFVGATVSYEADRPAVAARAVGLDLADSVLELITPTGDGPISRHLTQYGDGIRSVVFAVRNLDNARRYFTNRGVTLNPGDVDGSLAIPPDDACGLLFEVSE